MDCEGLPDSKVKNQWSDISAFIKSDLNVIQNLKQLADTSVVNNTVEDQVFEEEHNE